MKPYPVYPIALIALLCILAACGDEPPALPSTAVPVTIAPASELLTTVSGCATADLENWLESTYFLLGDFTTTLQETVNQSAEQVGSQLARLVTLRDALLAVPIPADCASEAHTLLIDITDPVLTALQAYASGDGPPPGDLMETAAGIEAEFNQWHEQLTAQLQAQFGTPAP